MTHAFLYKNENNEIVKFELNGHSGYAESGYDIVCASISILVINTINSIERFATNNYKSSFNEDSGIICFELLDTKNEKAKLLIKAMILGLEDISNNYSDYFKLSYRRYKK